MEKKFFGNNTDIVEEEIEIGEGNETRTILVKHFDRLSRYMFSGEQGSKITEKGEAIVDRRMVFMQGIDFAVALVKAHYDKKMKDEHKTFKRKLKRVEDQLYESALDLTSWSMTLNSKIKDSEIFKKIYIQNREFLKNQNIISFDKTAGYYETYVHQKYKIYIELFTQINFLLTRKNWISSSGTTEE